MLYAVSTGVSVVGWFLIVFGALCMIVGLLGAAKALLSSESAKPAATGWSDIIGALLKAGPWGVLMGVGLAAFLAGCTIVGIELKIPTG